MIGCDGCSEWYHGRCIGLTEETGKTVSSLECPVCAKQENREYKYDFLPYFLTYLLYILGCFDNFLSRLHFKSRCLW